MTIDPSFDNRASQSYFGQMPQAENGPINSIQKLIAELEEWKQNNDTAPPRSYAQMLITINSFLTSNEFNPREKEALAALKNMLIHGNSTENGMQYSTKDLNNIIASLEQSISQQ